MNGIHNEYAKALFMLAMEQGKGKEFEDALDFVSEIFSENPAYIQLLASPGIPMEERLSLIDKAFSKDLPENVLSFLKLLCEKGHITSFFACKEQYKALLNEVNKVSDAVVTSAVELSENEKEALKHKLEKLSGHSVILSYCVDSTILGGLIVEMDGKIMDSSLQKHLKQVKDVIGK